MTRTYAQAWAGYLAALEDCRVQMESDPAVQSDPKVRDAALYFPTQMQAAAFNMHMAPNPAYPFLYLHQIFTPFELSWGLPNPDYVYRYGYIDGRRRYRISGPRKSASCFFNFILFNDYFADNSKTLADLELNDFAQGDGRIEMILGPDESGPGTVRLDPSEHYMVFTVREALEDWSREEVTPLRIECLDADRGSMLYSEAELVTRIERATRLVHATTKRTLRNYHRLLERAGEENRFFIDGLSPERIAQNAHPMQTMVNCIFNVPPGQSLIIETEVPAARYWAISLGDPWWKVVDYTWHQSSLNRKNAWFGADGIFRAVLSHEDPGIQNWVDPVDNDRGQILIRLNKAESEPLPRTRLVPSATVRDHLPADTPRFSPEQRRQQIAIRTETVLRRYGY